MLSITPKFAATATLVLALFTLPATAKEVMQGPILARVVDVYDGDTFTVEANVWLGTKKTVKVRIVGIDTPEIRKPGCELERQKALTAKKVLTTLLGTEIRLYGIKYGKYAGRVLARVVSAAGDVGERMIGLGHARAYFGGKRKGWC